MTLLRELIGIAGMSAALWGLWQWSPPFAWIAGGVVCVLVAFGMERGKR